MNRLVTLFVITSGIFHITSCSSVKDATDFKIKAAKRIAPGEGLVTVWNTSTPLTLGNVYYLKSDNNGGKVLSSRYSRFVEKSNSKDYLQKSPVRATWNYNVDSSWNVKPQLTYMGFGVNPAFANTRTIKFNAAGDERYSINELDTYVREVLNSPGTGPDLREAVYQDTQRLELQKLPLSEARYWIVTDLITVKDLSIDFVAKPSSGVDVKIADVEALQKFLNVEGLSVSGSGGIVTNQNNRTTRNSTDPIGLVAWCVPLTAKKDGNDYVMRPQEDYPLKMANTLRAR